jgi:hypothetical protein
MGTLFEIAKTVGSMSGLFASAVLVWDRYTKHFPIAILVARPLSHGSSQIVPFLLVKNVSDRPILIAWDAGDSSRLRLAKDQSARAIMRGIIDDETVISLGPESETLLVVFKPSRYEEIDAENSLEIDLRWKFAQPRIWKAERRIKVWIRKRDLDGMLEGHMETSGEH